MKKIYRKPVTKVIVIEDRLLLNASQTQQPSEVKLPFDLETEEEGYAD